MAVEHHVLIGVTILIGFFVNSTHAIC